MATIKIYSATVKKGNNKIRYVINKQLPGDPVSVEGLAGSDPESVIKEFADVRAAHNSKCDKPFAEIIHSFSPEESKKLSPELVNKIGQEIVTTMFPGHQALVVTHLDRGHFHNHIILNRHHLSSGKLTRDSLQTVKNLRALNDRICQSYGLSIPNEDKKERESRMPQKVAKMVRYHRQSYIVDLMQKCDFARSLATNYDQYQGILAEFGINVGIEKKNISYQYPGQKPRKRGKNMGKLYDKAGLEQAFKQNDVRFQESPALRDILSKRMSQIKSTPEATRKLAGELSKETNGHFRSGVKDYSEHVTIPRREARWARASEEELSQCLVPIDELRKARRTSILGYCKQNGIKLEENESGKFTLKGRPYVEVSDFEWRNNKNNTRGSLIDLVAAHKKMTFLEAIAEINGNKRLLLLQNETGEVKRTYTSFYVPKPDRDQSSNALKHLSQMIGRQGVKKDHASALLKSEQVQISKNGLVRLFGKNDEYGVIEYLRDERGEWKARKRGQFTQPFFEKGGNGRKANVFLDPFSFMQSRTKRLFPEDKESSGTLALMQPDATVVDRFLSGQCNVDTVRIVAKDPTMPSKDELDFFGILKNRYQQHGIAVEFTSVEKTLPGRGIGLER